MTQQRHGRPGGAPDPARRQVLRLLGLGTGAVLVAGCTADGKETVVRVPLADLPEGERVHVFVGDEPVELQRIGEAVTARSLWCTHMGCRVNWDDERGLYVCPCHEGRFGADGRVVAGPALEGLRAVPLRLEGEAVVVGEEQA